MEHKIRNQAHINNGISCNKLLGLKGYLGKNQNVARCLEATFPGVQLSKPHREHPFRSYTDKRLLFCEWDIGGPKGNDLMLVMWPQHPSRAPFSNLNTWKAACEEFRDRHGHLLT